VGEVSVNLTIVSGTSVTPTISSGPSMSIAIGGANSFRAQYFYYTDGTNEVRRGVRDGYDVFDIALTDLGFNGIENTDWKNKESYEIPES